MDYEPKIIPEGINTTKEHPLREFAVLVFGLAAVIVLLTSLLALSADYLMGYIPVEKENEWFSSATKTSKNDDQPDSGDLLESEVETYLQRMIEQLQSEDKPDYRFTVDLIPGDVANAFIMPGGHIYVTSGLLGVIESENGLAMVLAHEMGHQYYRHPLRALGRTVVISLALMVISGTESDTLVQNFVGNAAIVTGLSFNRDQEREADRTGINLLLNHYGHASGSGEFFEAIKQQSETDFELPAFLSTHPGVDERIEMLQSHSRRTSGDKTTIPEVIALYLEYISNQNQETDHD